MAAVSGVNERTMGVASLASRGPADASHTVPRERDGAVLPCEKRAPRAHPVRQHAPTPHLIL